MTFEVQIFGASRTHTMKKVKLYLDAKDRYGDVIAQGQYCETASVKIAPGKTAYIPKITIYDRKKIGKISCAFARVEFTDGCPAYPVIDGDYWTWDIAW